MIWYLGGVLCVGGFVDAAFADREGAHADVFLQHVAIAEQQVLPMELLQQAENIGKLVLLYRVTASHTVYFFIFYFTFI